MTSCVEYGLWTHPAGYSRVVERIDARVCRISATTLSFVYVLIGRIEEIVVPPPAPPLRTNDLWKSTCFEAFLQPVGERFYREFNFAPSGQWAAYDFDDYRVGMVQANLAAPPEIELALEDDRLEMRVNLSMNLPHDSYRLGLSAVIDETIGPKSFWAANHTGSTPDFHRADCFVLELPPPPAP